MKIAFRVDTSSVIGLGHLKRCISLAKALRNIGGDCLFLCSDLDFQYRSIFASEGFAFIIFPADKNDQEDDGWQTDAQYSIQALGECMPHWVVVDHYDLDYRWHRTVKKETGCKIAVIDDLADRDFSCDLLLDQNYDEDHQQKYSGRLRNDSTCLFGPGYALLDPLYAGAVKYDFCEEVSSIGIFMGGMDSQNMSCLAEEAIRLSGFTGPVEIVTTSGNPALHELETRVANSFNSKLAIDLPNLVEFFARHDLQLGAGGSATWERCCIGAPSVLIPFVENHNIILGALEKLQIATAVPWGQDTALLADKVFNACSDVVSRHQQHKNGMALVDGEGSNRVAICLMRNSLRLRLATAEDCEQAFNWRNSPQVRAVSHNTQPIEWREHSIWFEQMIAGISRRLLVAEVGKRNVGHIRLDLIEDSEEVSFYLDPKLNGLGLGSKMLAAVENHAQSGRIFGRVVEDNHTSHRLFEKTGYHRSSKNRWEKRIGVRQTSHSS